MNETLNTVETPTVENTMTQGAANKNQSSEKSKMSKKQIIGLVILSLIAIGGVLFGVYGMNSQNDQIAQLTVRVADAEGKVAQLETEKITIADSDSETVEITDSVFARQNPVIKGGEYGSYDVTYNIPVDVQGSVIDTFLNFYVINGQFSNCGIPSVTVAGECNVNGVPDNIYKMATIQNGDGYGDEKIAFLMNDGSVWYAPIYEKDDTGALSINKNMTVKKANIDGFVKDIVDINYIDPNTHYGNASTVFVMDDDTYVKYDDSMFE